MIASRLGARLARPAIAKSRAIGAADETMHEGRLRCSIPTAIWRKSLDRCVARASGNLIMSRSGKGAGMKRNLASPVVLKTQLSDAPSPDAPIKVQGGKLLPHMGRVHLDQVSADLWQVSDILTNERVLLQGNPWSLYYPEDGDGRAAVLHVRADGQGEVKLVDDLMKSDIYEDSEGRRYFIMGIAGGQHVAVDTIFSKHSPGIVSFQTGAVGGESQIDVWCMTLPRAGSMNMFWDTFRLYALMKLSCYAKQPSKWVFTCVSSWEKCLGARFEGNHFIHSKHANISESSLERLAWPDRCLPAFSMSTLALMAMLPRWGLAKPCRGGLRGDLSRTAALELLLALVLKATARPTSSEFTLRMDDAWKCHWPRPPSYDETIVEVKLSLVVGGFLDMSDLMQPGAETTYYWQNLRKSLVKGGIELGSQKVPIMTFFEAVVPEESLYWAWAQVSLVLAKQVERALGQQGGDDIDDRCNMQFKTKGVEAGAKDMDEKLFQYVMASISESRRHSIVSVATDKATPSGMALHNTTISYANNKTVLCCPVVLPVGPHQIQPFPTPGLAQVASWQIPGFLQASFSRPELVDKRGWWIYFPPRYPPKISTTTRPA